MLWAASFCGQETLTSFFLACFRFHLASALSIVALGTDITERNSLSKAAA